MKEVELFIKSSDVKKVSGELFDLSSIEFKDINSDIFDKFDHEDISAEAKRLLEIRSTITTLQEYLPKNQKIITKAPALEEEEEKLLSKIIEETAEHKQHIHTNKNKLLHIEDELTRIDVIKGLSITKKEVESKTNTVGYIEKEKKNVLKTMRKQGIKYRTYSTGKRIYFLAKKVSHKLRFSYETYYIPTGKTQTKASLEKEERKAKEAIEHSAMALHITAHKYHTLLLQEEKRLSKEISVHEAKNNFVTTTNITIISGFIPENKIAKLTHMLDTRLGDSYELCVEDAPENAPVALANAKPLHKFENVLAMYSLPSYKEIDPTFILAITFPLFFGFVLGDVFYGLLSLIFFIYLKYKLPKFKEFIGLLQVCSISSIIFGIIYGEFMGYEFHGAWYGFFVRSHYPEQLLMYALFFGFIQINLGVLVGAINGMRKGFSYALTHHFSWLILEAGVGLMAAGGYFNQPPFLLIGGFLFVLSGILLYQGHGFAGVVEIPGFFTAIISYARLMAVGLSSITIAVLVNDFTHVLFAKGVVGIIFGIVFFSIGHIFNIGLGVFESFLHTMRLHYVEFFTKFYTGGGRAFKPFGNMVQKEE